MGAASSELFVTIAFLSCACGGATKPAATTDEKAGTHDSAHDTSDAATASSDDASEPAAPPRATCDDGTCAPCGDALCPSGWYCDQTAPSGPSCGWLPECASKSSCACLKKALACSCEEKSGGLYLSCK